VRGWNRNAGDACRIAGRAHAAEFQSAVANVGNDGLLLLVRTTNGSRFVVIK
jgi:hypothetical protein